MSAEFARLLLILVAIAVGFALIVAALVFMGGSRRSKRYRPGRPPAPVWFPAAPEKQSRAGIARPLPAGPQPARTGPRETGGASDRW